MDVPVKPAGFWRVLFTDDDANLNWCPYRIGGFLSLIVFLLAAIAIVCVFLHLAIVYVVAHHNSFDFLAFANAGAVILGAIAAGIAAVISGSGLGLLLKGKSGS